LTAAAEEAHMAERNPSGDNMDTDDITGTTEEDMIGRADEDDDDFDEDEEEDDSEDEEDVEGE